MFGIFKRKPCVHEYEVTDYRSYVDYSLDVEKEYEIACRYCGKKRVISPPTYSEMKRMGLIIERSVEQ